jgi:hypothetical protein
VGLLAVDLSAHGVVMSADSQPVEILGGQNRVLAAKGRRNRNSIVIRVGGGFVGLLGFAGTEETEGMETARWLERFSATWPDDDVGTFCHRLAETLTEVWQRDGLHSVLEILLSGEVEGDAQFWFVRNSSGLTNGRHNAPAPTFATENDLDDNYIPRDARPGETKDHVLARQTYSFFQGVLLPASPVFQGFGELLQALWLGQVEGFAPHASIDDVGQFARVRMEFLKRLCSEKHGIYSEKVPTPVAGQVHVYGVGRDGRICQYRKGRRQLREIRSGR